jgi:hypothetical protein
MEVEAKTKIKLLFDYKLLPKEARAIGNPLFVSYRNTSGSDLYSDLSENVLNKLKQENVEADLAVVGAWIYGGTEISDFSLAQVWKYPVQAYKITKEESKSD